MTTDGAPTIDQGIVVMAYGPRRYLRQARSLAQSLDHNSPGLHRTLVTDRPHQAVATTTPYDLLVPVVGRSRTDCRPKLDLDQYTPYRRTLYLDADSLVIRSLLPIFALLADHDLIVIGKSITTGHWYGDVASMRQLAGSASLPQFNGGLIGFVNTPRTHRVFSRARELAGRYRALGFDHFNGGIADEPLLAIAMASEQLGAHDLTSEVMASLLGVSGPVMLDVLAGACRFEKRGRPVAPAVVHFAADYSSRRPVLGAHYRRERLRLSLSHGLRLPESVARAIGAMPHGVGCWLLNRYYVSPIGTGRWYRMSPEFLWQLSISTRRKGARWLAKRLKQLNSVLYHNSLATGAVVGDHLRLGHHGLGVVIHDNVEIGDRVTIWQNVTLAVRAPQKATHKIVIENDVMIGANAVVITPLHGGLRIGSGAKVGAGAVVTRDVPPNATVVGVPAHVVRTRLHAGPPPA